MHIRNLQGSITDIINIKIPVTISVPIYPYVAEIMRISLKTMDGPLTTPCPDKSTSKAGVTISLLSIVIVPV